jgi:hypothetical protein
MTISTTKNSLEQLLRKVVTRLCNLNITLNLLVRNTTQLLIMEQGFSLEVHVDM